MLSLKLGKKSKDDSAIFNCKILKNKKERKCKSLETK